MKKNLRTFVVGMSVVASATTLPAMASFRSSGSTLANGTPTPAPAVVVAPAVTPPLTGPASAPIAAPPGVVTTPPPVVAVPVIAPAMPAIPVIVVAPAPAQAAAAQPATQGQTQAPAQQAQTPAQQAQAPAQQQAQSPTQQTQAPTQQQAQTPVQASGKTQAEQTPARPNKVYFFGPGDSKPQADQVLPPKNQPNQHVEVIHVKGSNEFPTQTPGPIQVPVITTQPNQNPGQIQGQVQGSIQAQVQVQVQTQNQNQTQTDIYSYDVDPDKRPHNPPRPVVLQHDDDISKYITCLSFLGQEKLFDLNGVFPVFKNRDGSYDGILSPAIRNGKRGIYVYVDGTAYWHALGVPAYTEGGLKTFLINLNVRGQAPITLAYKLKDSHYDHVLSARPNNESTSESDVDLSAQQQQQQSECFEVDPSVYAKYGENVDSDQLDEKSRNHLRKKIHAVAEAMKKRLSEIHGSVTISAKGQKLTSKTDFDSSIYGMAIAACGNIDDKQLRNDFSDLGNLLNVACTEPGGNSIVIQTQQQSGGAQGAQSGPSVPVQQQTTQQWQPQPAQQWQQRPSVNYNPGQQWQTGTGGHSGGGFTKIR